MTLIWGMTTGRRDVAVEDAAVGVQRDDALLDAGAGAVVEPDHRNPGGGGQVHHLVDLLGEDLAQGASEDGEVLAEDADPSAVDGAEAGDDTVGVGAVVLEPHAVGPVAGQHVELLEGALVEEVLDALPRRQLALGVVLLDGTGATGVEGLVLAFGQVGQAFGHGMFHAVEANAPGVPPEIGTVSLETGIRSHFTTEETWSDQEKRSRPGSVCPGSRARPHWGETNAASASGGSRGSIRWRACAARGEPDGRRRQCDRPHRSQRRRQDHVLQRHLRAADHQLGPDAL